MATAGEIVDRYFKAFGSGDTATARSLLRDNLDFKGPIDEFHNADDLMKSLQQLAQIVKGVEVRKIFVDGQDVCMIYDLVTNTPAGTSPVAEWHHVDGEKIASIRVYFDARPFAPMFGNRGS
jgi:ketosteroid isomerase-like protein